MQIKAKNKFTYGDKVKMGRKEYRLGPQDNMGGIFSHYPGTTNFVRNEDKLVGEYPEPSRKPEKWNKSKNVQLTKPNGEHGYFATSNNTYMK